MPDSAAHARSQPAARARGAAPWLSLGPASRMLGIDPDTLRRWADEGRVEAYLTPGGHRRFDRRTLERLAASRRPGVRPLASLGAGSDRFTEVYRRSYATDPTAHRIPPENHGELERYRRDGRRLVGALVAYLDADAADETARGAAEAQAVTVVEDFARTLFTAGTSLTEAVGLFVAARRPFLAELASLGRRRALDAARLGRLYEDASGLLDRLLLRLVATYREPGG